jgi:prepilin-type processing-associated H-X9-DG protein
MPIAFTCPHCGHETDVSDEYAGQSGPCARCGQTITVPLPGQVGFGTQSPAALPRAKRSTGWAVSLLGLMAVGLVLCCGAGVLLALFLPAVQKARETARTTQCAANLQRIGLAMQSYYDTYGSFPPAFVADAKGRPMHSWRALLLPYLDKTLAAQYRFDEPWDSQNNRRLHAKIPAVYRCPSDPSPTTSGVTDFVVISGQGAVFDGTTSSKVTEITDGTDVTLLVVEIVESDIVWLEPRDLRLQTITGSVNAPKGEEVSSNHPGGANVLTADGKVHFLNELRSQEDVHALATKAGGEAIALP